MQSNNSQQKPHALLAHAGGNLFAFTITSSPWLPLCPLSYELKHLFLRARDHNRPHSAWLASLWVVIVELVTHASLSVL